MRTGSCSLEAWLAPSCRSAETQPLRLWLHKELSKVFNKKGNAILAEVHSFQFTELTELDSAAVEEECNDAADGKVIFRAWTDKQSELQVNDQPHPTTVTALSSHVPFCSDDCATTTTCRRCR